MVFQTGGIHDAARVKRCARKPAGSLGETDCANVLPSKLPLDRNNKATLGPTEQLPTHLFTRVWKLRSRPRFYGHLNPFHDHYWDLRNAGTILSWTGVLSVTAMQVPCRLASCLPMAAIHMNAPGCTALRIAMLVAAKWWHMPAINATVVQHRIECQHCSWHCLQHLPCCPYLPNR